MFDLTADDVTAAEQQDTPIRPSWRCGRRSRAPSCRSWSCPGQVIEAGATLAFVISDMSTVWVQGNVYENDLGVGPPRRRRGRRDARRSPRRSTARCPTSATMLDPATRTTPVRIATRNAGRRAQEGSVRGSDDPRRRRAAGRWRCRRPRCSTTSRTCRSSTCRSARAGSRSGSVTIGGTGRRPVRDRGRPEGRRAGGRRRAACSSSSRAAISSRRDAAGRGTP